MQLVGDEFVDIFFTIQRDLQRKIGRKVSHLIWLAMVWCIWLNTISTF